MIPIIQNLHLLHSTIQISTILHLEQHRQYKAQYPRGLGHNICVRTWRPSPEPRVTNTDTILLVMQLPSATGQHKCSTGTVFLYLISTHGIVQGFIIVSYSYRIEICWIDLIFSNNIRKKTFSTFLFSFYNMQMIKILQTLKICMYVLILLISRFYRFRYENCGTGRQEAKHFC